VTDAADRLAIRDLVDAYGDGDRARGESYCLAHHISFGADTERTIMIASIRYLDEFVKEDGEWFFAERRLMVDWTETRPCAP